MRAYISSSLHINEQYIITLLAMHLQDKGLVVTTHFHGSNELSYSHLFIGIISKKGSNKNSVIDDLKYAKLYKIPHLLLVEKGIVLPATISKSTTVVRFNRTAPEPAIAEVKDRIKIGESRSKQVRTKGANKDQETVAWMLGGAALLTLIALFSDSKK